MGEIKTEATVCLINYICDDCNAGKMVRSGPIMLTDPPKFPHKCENCGHKDSFQASYPFPRFEPVSEKPAGH